MLGTGKSSLLLTQEILRQFSKEDCSIESSVSHVTFQCVMFCCLRELLVLMWEEFFFFLTLVVLLVKLLVVLNSIICKKSKPQAQLLRLALFFQINCFTSKGKSLSRVQLFATPWTSAYQAPLSMGFSRQEYWSGVLSPSPDFTSKPALLRKWRINYLMHTHPFPCQHTQT